MRYGPDDKFWMVVDPTPTSVLTDIVFETPLGGFARQLKGGLSMDSSPTMFADREEAGLEAERRLVVMRASRSARPT